MRAYVPLSDTPEQTNQTLKENIHTDVDLKRITHINLLLTPYLTGSRQYGTRI